MLMLLVLMSMMICVTEKNMKNVEDDVDFNRNGNVDSDIDVVVDATYDKVKIAIKHYQQFHFCFHYRRYHRLSCHFFYIGISIHLFSLISSLSPSS